MRAEKIADGPFGPVAVGYIDKWAEDKYAYGRNGMVSYDKEYEGPGLAEVAKAFM